MINATNETIKKLLSGPIFFKKNRVGRVYTGGALFADFFGDDSTDGYLPEEWVVSTVSALNKGSTIYKEGVSVIADTDIFFDEFISRVKGKIYPRLADSIAFKITKLDQDITVVGAGLLGI